MKYPLRAFPQAVRPPANAELLQAGYPTPKSELPGTVTQLMARGRCVFFSVPVWLSWVADKYSPWGSSSLERGEVYSTHVP